MSPNFSPGARLGRYEIKTQLGAGGMGEVYLAQDTKLDRKVALKILPANLAANQDRMRRFVQEAKAAAALNHPNIAHIYEIGGSNDTNFIAMEFVDSKTLRERLHGEKSELRALLRHLLQVAEGLAKAHTSGIVHRDLKPDNIMITREGHAKILDFDLAKLLETKPESAAEMGEAATAMMPVQHSTPGVVMGTVGYMSPEQAQAKAVDQRSDIFSFGCLLSHHQNGFYLAMMGRTDQSISEMEKAQRLAPLDINLNSDLAAAYLYAGEFERAIDRARSTIEIDPNYWLPHVLLGIAYERKGQFTDAVRELEKAHSLENGPWVTG